MKTFAISAALLASTAVAMPTPSRTRSVGSLVPCLQKELIPSGGLPTGVLTCIESAMPSGLTSLTKDLPLLSGLSNIAGGSDSASSGAISGLHSVLSVTHTLNSGEVKNLVVELDGKSAQLLAGAHLGSVANSVGSVLQTAPVVSQLNLAGQGEGLLTVVDTTGSALLVKLNDETATLFNSLGLSDVSSLVGTVIGTLDGFLQSLNLKRDSPLSILSSLPVVSSLSGLIDENGVTSILSQSGETLPLKLDSGLLSNVLSTVDLTNLGDLSNVQGTIGSVVSKAESIPELVQQLPVAGEVEGVFMGVLSQDGGALLVKVESTLEGLLSGLGLGSIGSAAGSVIGEGTSLASGTGILGSL
ncbi:uncharacterized protein PFLUO_LOCUS514 [Penicillium psychrofluorescens]|uniref:uncharacterized protein n=1 Tax=Penicillium psychrofluorescens TaxID=3158075 RepID=UPI003CCE12C1